MKIGILSRHPHCYSTHRLVEAAKQKGHAVEVIDYLRCYINIAAHNPHVLYAGRKLHYDAVIPRIAARHTFYGTAVVRQFEMMHLFTANESQAITRSKDKLRCLQLLSRKGIGLPVTGCAHSTKDIEGLIQIVGGAPLIIKLLEGTQGIGVVLAETQKAAESVISAFRELDAHILVQEFIKEYAGQDIRALVIGNRVIAAMKRVSTTGDFRSNLHQGGKAEKVKLTAEEKSIAIHATKALGLNIAGIDLMRSHHGPVILEVNSSPGLRGIEECTGKDVAKAIIEFVEKKVSPSNIQNKMN